MGILKKIKTKTQEHHQKRLAKALEKEKRHSSMQPVHYGEELFSWLAPEYIKHERGSYWYIIAGILAFTFIVWGLFNDSWTFSLVMVIFCAVYYMHHFEHPRDVQVVITEMGIKLGRKLIPFRNIKAFWIYYMPGHVETLNIFTCDPIFPEVSIQLNGQNPVPLRNFMLSQVPEWEGKEESFVEAILRLLKI